MTIGKFAGGPMPERRFGAKRTLKLSVVSGMD